MLTFLLRYWYRDAAKFLLASALVFLITLTYVVNADGLNELAQGVSSPARRFFGGDAVVVNVEFQPLIWLDRDRDLESLVYNSIPFSASILPPGEWALSLFTLTDISYPGGSVERASICGLSSLFASPDLAFEVVAGRNLEPSDDGDKLVLISESFHLACDIHVGDHLRLSLLPYGEPYGRPEDFTVVGIYRDELLRKEQTLFVPLRTLQDLLDAGDLVGCAALDESRRENFFALSWIADELPPQLKTFTTKSILSGVIAELEESIWTITLLNALVLAICLACIAASSLYLVSIRRREFGLLLACGLSPWGLALLVTGEAAMSAGLAAAAGSLGYGCWRVLTGENYYLWRESLFLVGVVTGAAVLFSLIPIARLAGISQMEVLRNE